MKLFNLPRFGKGQVTPTRKGQVSTRSNYKTRDGRSINRSSSFLDPSTSRSYNNNVDIDDGPDTSALFLSFATGVSSGDGRSFLAQKLQEVFFVSQVVSGIALQLGGFNVVILLLYTRLGYSTEDGKQIDSTTLNLVQLGIALGFFVFMWCRSIFGENGSLLDNGNILTYQEAFYYSSGSLYVYLFLLVVQVLVLQLFSSSLYYHVDTALLFVLFVFSVFVPSFVRRQRMEKDELVGQSAKPADNKAKERLKKRRDSVALMLDRKYEGTFDMGTRQSNIFGDFKQLNVVASLKSFTESEYAFGDKKRLTWRDYLKASLIGSVSFAIIFVYPKVVSEYYLGGDVRMRMIIALIVHPVLSQLIMSWLNSFKMNAVTLVTDHMRSLKSLYDYFWVESFLVVMKRLLIYNVGTFEDVSITILIMFAIDISIRSSTYHRIVWWRTSILKRKSEEDEPGMLKQMVAASMIFTSILEISAIVIVAALVIFFSSHRLVFNFGNLEPGEKLNTGEVFLTFFVSFVAECVVTLLSFDINQLLEVPFSKELSQLDHPIVYLGMVGALISSTLLSLCAYRSTPNLIQCTSEDVCDCDFGSTFMF